MKLEKKKGKNVRKFLVIFLAALHFLTTAETCDEERRDDPKVMEETKEDRAEREEGIKEEAAKKERKKIEEERERKENVKVRNDKAKLERCLYTEVKKQTPECKAMHEACAPDKRETMEGEKGCKKILALHFGVESPDAPATAPTAKPQGGHTPPVGRMIVGGERNMRRKAGAVYTGESGCDESLPGKCLINLQKLGDRFICIRVDGSLWQLEGGNDLDVISIQTGNVAREYKCKNAGNGGNVQVFGNVGMIFSAEVYTLDHQNTTSEYGKRYILEWSRNFIINNYPEDRKKEL